MFKKKALIACYIYSSDYSGDSLRLDDLMFRVVPVKRHCRKYSLLGAVDREKFGSSISKNEMETVLKRGCHYIVFFENYSIENRLKALRLLKKKTN